MSNRIITVLQQLLIAFFVLLAPVVANCQEEQNEPPQQQEATNAEDEQNEPDRQREAADSETQKDSTSEQETPTPEEKRPDGEQAEGSLFIPPREEQANEIQEAEKTPETTEESRTYIIKQGDTLWDISNTFLKDPFLWPFIWKANTYIANADLIYPGNTLVIPSLAPIERALQSPVQEPPTGKNIARPASTDVPAIKQPPLQTSPTGTSEAEKRSGGLILPDEEPIPVVDKYSMLNAGFISEEESRDIILESKEEKTIFGYDDIVFVSIPSNKDAAIGEKFIIYRPLDKVRHPATGKIYGRLIKVLGILELTQKGGEDIYAARITLSFDAAGKGNMLTPYQEPVLIYKDAVKAKTKDISGYILEVMDTRTINADTDIVYLDKGSADGVDAGDVFLVYPKKGKKNFPVFPIGEAQVFLVKEHTSTAIVRKSSNALAKGDKIEYKH